MSFHKSGVFPPVNNLVSSSDVKKFVLPKCGRSEHLQRAVCFNRPYWCPPIQHRYAYLVATVKIEDFGGYMTLILTGNKIMNPV